MATVNASGLQFTHATPSPATTGYSVVMDVYYASIPNYVSLLQLDNTTDGDVFGRGSGAMGINGDYAGTSLTAGAWHRVAATVDSAFGGAFLNLYVDGVLSNSVDSFNPNRFDLSDPSFLVFADED